MKRKLLSLHTHKGDEVCIHKVCCKASVVYMISTLFLIVSGLLRKFHQSLHLGGLREVTLHHWNTAFRLAYDLTLSESPKPVNEFPSTLIGTVLASCVSRRACWRCCRKCDRKPFQSCWKHQKQEKESQPNIANRKSFAHTQQKPVKNGSVLPPPEWQVSSLRLLLPLCETHPRHKQQPESRK